MVLIDAGNALYLLGTNRNCEGSTETPSRTGIISAEPPKIHLSKGRDTPRTLADERFQIIIMGISVNGKGKVTHMVHFGQIVDEISLRHDQISTTQI